MVRAARERRPTLAQRLAVARQVAGCYLQTATPKCAHRDLKPGNVFVLDAMALENNAPTRTTEAIKSDGPPPLRDGETGTGTTGGERARAVPSLRDVSRGRGRSRGIRMREDAPFVVVADSGSRATKKKKLFFVARRGD